MLACLCDVNVKICVYEHIYVREEGRERRRKGRKRGP